MAAFKELRPLAQRWAGLGAFDVTDDEMDAPDGAIVDGYERVDDRWLPTPLSSEEKSTMLDSVRAHLDKRRAQRWTYTEALGELMDELDLGIFAAHRLYESVYPLADRVVEGMLAPARGSAIHIETELLSRPGIDVVHVADDPANHPGVVAVAYLGETNPAVVKAWLVQEIGALGQVFDVACYGSLPGGVAYG